jgi:hypothetical protein
MVIQRSPPLERQLDTLPSPTRQQVNKVIRLLEHHGLSYPSLRAKRLEGPAGYWEVTVTMRDRLVLAHIAGTWVALRLATHEGIAGKRLKRYTNLVDCASAQAKDRQ